MSMSPSRPPRTGSGLFSLVYSARMPRKPKQCPDCGQTDLAEFAFHSPRTRPGRLRSHCRPCDQARKRAYYQANAAKMTLQNLAAAKRGRQVKYEKLFQYLSQHPCVDCGETDVEVLECDHVRGFKADSVVEMVRHNRSWDVIAEELAKCEVRCANCHRRKTNRQFGYRRATWRTG